MFDYAIEVLRKEILSINSYTVVSVYPKLKAIGKRAFKNIYKKQMKELKQAIKILKESEVNNDNRK